MKRWSVEVSAFGRISIMKIEAPTRAQAERIALDRIDLKVQSKELPEEGSGIPEQIVDHIRILRAWGSLFPEIARDLDDKHPLSSGEKWDPEQIKEIWMNDDKVIW